MSPNSTEHTSALPGWPHYFWEWALFAIMSMKQKYLILFYFSI